MPKFNDLGLGLSLVGCAQSFVQWTTPIIQFAILVLSLLIVCLKLKKEFK